MTAVVGLRTPRVAYGLHMVQFFNFYFKTKLMIAVFGPFRVEELVSVENAPSINYAF